MMASSDVRYGSNSQNTSKYVNDLLNEFVKMPHSVFDETRKKIMDVTQGAIHPIECWEMLPGSDAYITYDIQLITKNPTIKRLLSSMKAELRVYQCNYNDCWEGWNNFITKGRSGKVSLSIPYVDLSLNSNDVTTSLPYNPMESMSLQPCVFLAKNDEGKKFTVEHNEQVQSVSNLQSSGKTGISTLADVKASTALRTSALPFVLYNKIAKKYQSPNLLQNNPHWYPENENHDMILPYNSTGAVSTSDYDNPTKSFVVGTSLVNPSEEIDETTEEYESYPWLNVLQYAQRRGDYFNTGSPFPDLIRGDIPTLQAINASLDWSKVFTDENGQSLVNPHALLAIGNNDDSDSILGLLRAENAMSAIYRPNVLLKGSQYPSSDNDILIEPTGRFISDNTQFDVPFKVDSDYSDFRNIFSKVTVSGIEFSANMWRYLMTMTVLKERLAMTDGSYNGLVKAMFGHNPNWHSHDCKYCGGSVQPIIFSEVVNTSDNGNAPLGETAGRAISSSMNNTIHVHSDDFGMFMTVLVLTQDEYYSQGVDKMFNRLENAEQYLPILNNLAPDATLNKELYVSGDNNDDNDIFNYQERFAYYKSRRNQVSGLMSLSINKIGDIGAYLFNRIFDSVPNFNQEFSLNTPTSNEKAVFASTNQAEFCAVIGSQLKYIAPIPEVSRPSDMGISY